MLSIKNLSKSYGKDKILNSINISFPDIGLYYILGPSGSGKTTLLNIISTIEDDYQGDVFYDEIEFRKISEKEKQYLRQKIISVAFQEDKLDPHTNIFNNINLPQIITGQKIINNNKVKNLLYTFGIDKLVEKPIKHLSGGEAKRVGIIRCLLKEAKIYLLDEPLNGLDENRRKMVTNILKELSKKALVIIITHQKEEIETDSNVLYIKDGKIESKQYYYSINKKSGSNKGIAGKMSLINHFRLNIKKIFAYKTRMYMNFISLMVAFFSLGLSCLLLFGVKTNIINSFTSGIFSDSILVEEKDKTIINDERKDIDDDTLQDIKYNFKDYIINSSKYYIADYTKMFPNENKITFKIANYNLTSSLRILDLINTINIEEIVYKEQIRNLQLKSDELILGGDEPFIKTLSNYLGCSLNINEINKYIKITPLTMCLSLDNNEWKYSTDVLFTIKQVIEFPKLTFIHTDPEFVPSLIENDLQLEVSKNKESSDKYPWTVKSETYLTLKHNSIDSFIKDFLSCDKYRNYNLLPSRVSITDEDNIYDTRIGIEQMITKRMKIINEVDERLNDKIINKYFSSSLYLNAKEGLIKGFYNPIYISSKKNKINKIIDTYYETDESMSNLREFSIADHEEIVSGDVYSSIKQKGFYLLPIPKQEVQGRLPTSVNEIIISSSLARSIGFEGNNGYCYFAYLNGLDYKNNKYFTNFIYDKLNVVGIVDSPEKVIYQNEFFPTSFGLLKLKTSAGCDIDSITYRVDMDEKNLIEIKNILQKELNDFYFSLPGLETFKGINNSLEPLTIALTSFSIIIFLISGFLLIFTLSLYIIEDKRYIATKLIFGSSKKDIKKSYYILSLIYGFISSTNAMLLLFFIQLSFKKTLNNIIGSLLGFSAWPYIVILISCIILSTFSAKIALHQIKNKDLKSLFN